MLQRLLFLCFLLLGCMPATRGFAEEGAPITVSASPAMCISGKPVEISGKTIVGKEAMEVTVVITYPGGKDTSITVKTDKKGAYKMTFAKAFATGQYTVTAKAADGKRDATATFMVATISAAAADLQKDFFKSTQVVQSTLGAVVSAFKALPPSAENNAQIEKLESYKKKLSDLKAAEEKLANALKELSKATADVPVSEKWRKDLEASNKALTEKLPVIEAKVQQIENKSNTCEMLNNMIEACGFISLVLDFKTTALKTLRNNLGSDKLIPGGLDRLIKTGNDAEDEKKKLAINTAQKAALAASDGAYSFAGFVGTGLSLDLCSYIGKYIYGRYCEDLKGDFLTTFRATFQNDNGLAWWIYDLDLKGELKLRYKKNTDLSAGTEITGEFSGYRVRYGIKEDFELAEPVPKGMTLFKKEVSTPTAVDLSYISSDLGSIATAMVPGSFRVAVKGIVTGDNLKLEVIASPFDASEHPETNNLYIVLLNAMLPIPVIRSFDIPIAKNKQILIAALKGETFKLVRTEEKVTLELKDRKNKLPLGDGVFVNTKINLKLSN